MNHFDELYDALKAQGFGELGERVRAALASGSTSSEALGAAGLELLRIERDRKNAFSRATREAFGACMEDVRTVWPSLKLPEDETRANQVKRYQEMFVGGPKAFDPGGLPPSGKSVFAWICAGVLFLVGFGDMAATAYQVCGGLGTGRWTPVEATVTKSAADVRSGRGRRGGASVQGPGVEFSYTVDGTQYASQKVQYGLRLNKRWLHSEYPEGKKVRAFHDPSRPERSVLRKGLYWIDVLGSLGLELVFYAFALLVLFAADSLSSLPRMPFPPGRRF